MSWQVPLSDIAMPDADVDAVLDCLRSGWLTMGPRTAAFEQAFSDYIGARHAIAVSSGTAALHLSLLAAGIGAGDEVIVPGFTFVASAAAVRYVGAEPVLCDVASVQEPNADVASVRAKITARTRAVLPVHFMGYPAPALELRGLCDEHGLALIEDTCQAIGAWLAPGVRAGTAGELGCFSFFSKKQLCTGEGGMVVCESDLLAERVRSLRSHAMTSMSWDRHRGHAESYDIVDVGFNFRLDEPRAALGLSRLDRLEDDISARRALVARYREQLSGVAGIELLWPGAAWQASSSHFAFPMLLESRDARDAFRAELSARGVQSTYYPSVSQLSEYAAASLPLCEEVGDRHCALPLFCTLSFEAQDRVVAAVRETLG